MLATTAWLLMGIVLLAAAALKAADRTGTIVALAAYGVSGRLAAPAFAALVAVEAALAASLAAGIGVAPQLAALVLAGFLCAQVVALMQGNEGAPCGCFGSGGRLSRAAAGRTALLACTCAALPLLGDGPSLPLVLTAAIAAAVVVLATDRRSAPRGALELDGEGPPLGESSALAEWFVPEHASDAGIRLALFTSPRCALCRKVAPAADALAADGVAVRRFDETEDTEAWAAARVPGAPFAVALGLDGVALAKGTVNDGRQLASILEAARARSAGSRRAFADRAGGAAATADGSGSRRAFLGSADGAAAPADGSSSLRVFLGDAGSAAATADGSSSRRAFLGSAGGAAAPADGSSSRRAFLGRAGSAAATAAGAGMVGAVIRPGDADAHHFCGHIYTTDGCPHPTGLPRIDRRGLPLRARDGRRVDDLGRLIDALGRPLDEDGFALTDLDGRPLPAAPRTPVCTLTGATRRIPVEIDGAWYRCCGGRVRKLVDCCSPNRTRINGDRALRGYCYDKRKVYCVMYFQSSVPC